MFSQTGNKKIRKSPQNKRFIKVKINEKIDVLKN